MFNVTNSSLPISVFIRDNVSHIKYPVALVSSPKRAYIPLSTYLYEAVLEAHISNYGAVISVRTSEPVLLQVKLHYTENLSSTKVVGPLSDKDKIYINESFMYIEVEPLIVKGLLYFRVSDEIAELYPTDNLGLFAVLIAVPVTLGIAILRFKKFSNRNY